MFGNTRVNEEDGKYSLTITFLSLELMFLHTLRMSGTRKMDGGDDGYIKILVRKLERKISLSSLRRKREVNVKIYTAGT